MDLSEACVSHADRDWADLRDANVSDAEPQRGATDSSLVAEGVRVLTRALKRIERMTGVLGQNFCNRKRATTRRGAADFARGTQSQSEGYRARWKQDTGALGLARATVRDAERIMAEPAEGARVYRYLAGCGKTEFLKRLFHYLLLTAFSSSFGIFPAGPIH